MEPGYYLDSNNIAELGTNREVHTSFFADELVHQEHNIRSSLSFNLDEVHPKLEQFIRLVFLVNQNVATVNVREELKAVSSGNLFDVPVPKEYFFTKILIHHASLQIVSTKHLDLPLDEDTEMKNVLSTLNGLGYHGSAVRIQELWDIEEREEGDVRLTIDSAVGFSAFMSKFKSNFNLSEEPLVGLFSEGTLIAEWRLEDEKYLAIEFFDRNTVCYGMTSPEIKATTNEPGFGDEGEQDSIIDALLKHGLNNWEN